MTRVLAAIAACLALCVGPLPASAEKRVALVVGINDYPTLPNGQLTKAVADADTMGETLRALGFDVEIGRNLNRAGFLGALDRTKRKVGEGDTVFVFFAGHGVAFKGTNLLLPSDMPAIDPDSEQLIRGLSIAETDVIDALRDKGAGLVVLALDACRNNPIEEFAREQARAQGRAFRSTGMRSTGLEARPASGVFSIYSAGLGQKALDGLSTDRGERNSVFTRVFASRLREPGRHLSDLMEEVREEVARLAAAELDPQTRRPHQQFPAFYNETRGGRVYLAGRGTADPPAPGGRVSAPTESARVTPPPPVVPTVVPPLGPGEGARPVETPAERRPPINVRTITAQSWRLTSSFPRAIATTADRLVTRAAELSGGRLQVTLFHAGEIVPSLQVLDAVGNKWVELGYTSGSYYVGKDPAFAFLSGIPFGFEPRAHLAWRQRPEVKAAFDSLLARHQVVGMPCGAFSRPEDFASRRPVRTADDLKGMKIRVGGLAGQIYQSVGAIPQQLSGGDIYPALEKGTIDAAVWLAPGSTRDIGLHRIARNYYYPGVVTTSQILDLIVNKQVWDGLPASARQVLEQACQEATEAMIAQHEAADAAALATMRQEGTQVTQLPPAVQRALLEGFRRLLADLAGRNDTVRALASSFEAAGKDSVAARLQP